MYDHKEADRDPIFASDHSIPDSVSLEDYRFVVGLVRETGKY